MLQLGLVCISNTLKSQGISFRTMTRKSFQAGGAESKTKLYSIWVHNIFVMGKIIAFCAENNIQHYRVSSNLFPLATDPITNVKFSDIDLTARRLLLRQVGDLAREKGISISNHPDAFNVVGSDNDNIVKNTIRELNFQASVLDDMGFPDAPMCLHVAKSPSSGDENVVRQYVERFKSNFRRANESVKRKLCLENEHNGYWSADKLLKWFSDFKLVFDNLHFDCSNPENLCPLETAAKFKKTWGNCTPIFHWSEGKDGGRSHVDYATHIPEVVLANKDVVWEVEMKAKDLNIFKIRAESS